MPILNFQVYFFHPAAKHYGQLWQPCLSRNQLLPCISPCLLFCAPATFGAPLYFRSLFLICFLLLVCRSLKESLFYAAYSQDNASALQLNAWSPSESLASPNRHRSVTLPCPWVCLVIKDLYFSKPEYSCLRCSQASVIKTCQPDRLPPDVICTVMRNPAVCLLLSLFDQVYTVPEILHAYI